MIQDTTRYTSQFQFQSRYACGRVANIGANTDGAGLGKRPKAVNVDYVAYDYHVKEKLPISRAGRRQKLAV